MAESDVHIIHQSEPFLEFLGDLKRIETDVRLGEPDDGESLKQVGKDPAREYQVHLLRFRLRSSSTSTMDYSGIRR